MIACVSPADKKIEASLDILRLAVMARKVKNNPRQNKGKNLLTQEECLMIRAENEKLKAKIRELMNEKNRVSGKEIREFEHGALSNLQAKMKQAEEAARNARECSHSVAAAADRWRTHREKLAKASNVRKTLILETFIYFPSILVSIILCRVLT